LYNSASQKELLLTIRDEAERLNRFVMNLLDMMKLKSGLKLNQEWVDFQDLLGSSISRLTNLLENRRVVIDIPPDLPMLFVDFVLFDHVLLNLLDNAVKYSSEGSYITISARKGINSVQIEIQDEGIGVPVTELDLIFEEFYRVKRTSSISGTGLGLSICRGIVQAHGGRIFITSPDSGKGTSVILEISSADQNPAIMDDPDRTEEQMVTGSIFSERLRLSS
jgi:two-component system sensor histidine kinase KdpD